MPDANLFESAIVRWAMGGSALSAIPEDLRARLGGDEAEAELGLLAIAGQTLGIAAVPQPAGDLSAMPDIPALALPTMPNHLRPLAARVLQRKDEWIRNALLEKIEARGFVVHPADWMPSRSSVVPDIYGPWKDWAEGQAEKDGGLSVETWGSIGPAVRRSLFGEMRRTDPAAARAIAEACLGGEGVDVRAGILDMFAVGLGSDDADYLRTFAADRAPRVKAIAARLLARLGHAADMSGIGDVSDFLRVSTKGLIRKSSIIEILPTGGRVQERRDLMQSIDATTLAASLGIADVEIAGLWPWRDPVMDHLVSDILLGSGSDAVVASFEAVLRENDDIDIHAVSTSGQRLSDDALTLITRRELARGGKRLTQVLTTLPRPVDLDGHREWPAWQALQQGLAIGSRPTDMVDEALSLGLLLDRSGAHRAMGDIVSLGIPSADPRFDTLRLSASL